MTDRIPRIYADANEADAGDHFWLHIRASPADIDRYGNRLKPGMRVLFNVQDAFEAEGILEVDELHGTWLSQPGYNISVWAGAEHSVPLLVLLRSRWQSNPKWDGSSK